MDNHIFLVPDSLTDCKIINRNESTSLGRRIFTAGISKSKDKRYLQIGIQEGEQMSLLFDLDDKIDSAYNTISLIRAAKDDVTESDLEDKDEEEEEGQQQIMSQKTLCNACESPNDMEAHFCSKCGNKLSVVEDATEITTVPQPLKPILGSYNAEKENAYFRSEGEVLVKKTEHRGAGRKVASWLAACPIGYVATGRDKTRKTKARGTLVVTEKAIYCAGNVYPYDVVLAFTKKRKSILLLFEKSFNDQRFSVTLELKTRESDALFKALETARMSHIKC
jgi:hypothetical protein